MRCLSPKNLKWISKASSCSGQNGCSEELFEQLAIALSETPVIGQKQRPRDKVDSFHGFDWIIYITTALNEKRKLKLHHMQLIRRLINTITRLYGDEYDFYKLSSRSSPFTLASYTITWRKYLHWLVHSPLLLHDNGCLLFDVVQVLVKTGSNRSLLSILLTRSFIDAICLLRRSSSAIVRRIAIQIIKRLLIGMGQDLRGNFEATNNVELKMTRQLLDQLTPKTKSGVETDLPVLQALEDALLDPQIRRISNCLPSSESANIHGSAIATPITEVAKPSSIIQSSSKDSWSTQKIECKNSTLDTDANSRKTQNRKHMSHSFIVFHYFRRSF